MQSLNLSSKAPLCQLHNCMYDVFLNDRFIIVEQSIYPVFSITVWDLQGHVLQTLGDGDFAADTEHLFLAGRNGDLRKIQQVNLKRFKIIS